MEGFGGGDDGRFGDADRATHEPSPAVLAVPVGIPSARKLRKSVLKRLHAAREGLFPHKTCPASRHVHMIVEGMLDPKGSMHSDLRGYDPEHMAESIASVLEGLWRARRWMRWQPNIVGDHMAGGEWVPDMDAIVAQAIEAGTDETRSGSAVGESAVRKDAPKNIPHHSV